MNSLRRGPRPSAKIRYAGPPSGRRTGVAAYLLVAPFLLTFIVFQAFALVAALGLSFTDWRGSAGGSWVGFNNYLYLFQDEGFLLALWNTAVLWVATVPVLSFGSLAIAYLLIGPIIRFAKLHRTLLFLPVLPSLVVAGTLFLHLLDPGIGMVSKLLAVFGLDPVRLQTDPSVAIPVIAVVVIWRWLGYNMIIHLAALANLPAEILEAATIDRASRWQTFWRIVVPMSKPMLLFTTVISTIGIAGLFDEPYVLLGSSGGPSQGGLTLGVFMYREGFQYFNLGYASAITYVITAIVLVFALIQMRLSRDD